jgi:osmotically inducible lipoprotein OsmB
MAFGLAACGDDPGTRAVTGGMMGAGLGAGIAAATDGRRATAAAMGGGVVGGAVTMSGPRLEGPIGPRRHRNRQSQTFHCLS